MLPWFVTVPTGIGLVVFLWGHLMALNRTEGMDATRKRIRQVNGVVMMLLVPALVSGLSIFDWKREPGSWVIAWSVCIVLVALMVVMAMLDALNTARLARERRHELREWLLGQKGAGDE